MKKAKREMFLGEEKKILKEQKERLSLKIKERDSL